MATAESMIRLPPLPYAHDALEPYMSRETLDYHYGKHHQAYIDNVNRLIRGTPQQPWALDELVMRADGALYDNAAQAWNHAFFWRCLSPRRQTPGKELEATLRTFGGLESLQSEFTRAAVAVFGSGWAWLIKDQSGAVRIVTTPNAHTPLRDGHKPLLTCDMWEHAYYIDHRNDRGAYLRGFWQLVNWDFVAGNLH
ncbi:MAG TPA: superoxide dismutase [Steroidobacteraceae bacterium]|nr:superoxide dismutase [Steroidobacteraceae bacterium]